MLIDAIAILSFLARKYVKFKKYTKYGRGRAKVNAIEKDKEKGPFILFTELRCVLPRL